jgi:septal ring factor EnvC (AmiA/AmiB activator)
MALKFFSILKANAEVSRLETELASAQQKISAFETAAPENLAALQDELASTKSSFDKAQTELLAANESLKSLAAKDSEIAALKEASVKLEASVEARASEKALSITQSQGQTKPVAADKKEVKPLSRAEFNALSISAQNDFFRSGGKLI